MVVNFRKSIFFEKKFIFRDIPNWYTDKNAFREKLENERQECIDNDKLDYEWQSLQDKISGEMMSECVAEPPLSLLSADEQRSLDSYLNNTLYRRIDSIDPNFLNYFMTPEVEALLNSNDLFSRNPSGYKFKVKIGGKKWFVSEAYWSPIQHPEKLSVTERQIVIHNAKNPLIKASVHLYPLKTLQKRLSGWAEGAVLDWKNQEQGRRTLRKFDLPKDEEIAYLSLYPTEADLDIALAIGMEGAERLPQIFRSKGYNVEIATPEMTSDPKGVIRSRIETARKKGKNSMVIDLHGHGYENDGIKYDNPMSLRRDSNIFYGEDLVDICNQYPDMQFFIMNDACYGGGFRDAFLEAKLPNVTLVLSSKPFFTANTLEYTSGPEGGTYRTEFFQKAISLTGKDVKIELPDGRQIPLETIGDAIYYADIMTAYSGAYDNPEIILPGGILIAGRVNLEKEFRHILA